MAQVESNLKFSEKHLTQGEWVVFWGWFMYLGIYLEQPLGKWAKATHHRWD